MVWVLVGPVVIPLLQIAVLADAVWQQLGDGLVQTVDVFLRLTQYQCGIAGVDQAFLKHGDVGKSTIHRATIIAVGSSVDVLRRSGRSRQQVAVLFYEPAQAEVGGTLQHGIDLAQVVLVHAERIVFPQVGANPCATRVPVCP